MTPHPIRLDAPAANDNSIAARAGTSDPLSRPRERAALARTDSRRPEAPTVSISADRNEHAYACSGNLILPLRFARRLPGWCPDLTSVTKG